MYLLYLSTLLHFISATSQFNLYYTSWTSEKESNSNKTLQYNCLRVITNDYIEDDIHEIIFYCMSEPPSELNVSSKNLFPNFTFVQLATWNISSENLYSWSAPIDLIERYQDYLNQLPFLNDYSLEKDVFYNCTLPRFGPMCQYQFDFYRSGHLSVGETINNFYSEYSRTLVNLTCYTHLECNRGPLPVCLDWSEICDGKIDCLGDGVDEEHCWELEINECKDDEYRCNNGQCISKSFYRDSSPLVYCFDGSGKGSPRTNRDRCFGNKPAFRCVNTACEFLKPEGLCVDDRRIYLWKATYAIEDGVVSAECWSALKCFFDIIDAKNSNCEELCGNDACRATVQRICPEMLYFPNAPMFFDDIYFAFRKSDLADPSTEGYQFPYICTNNSAYDDFFNMTSSVIFNNGACFALDTFEFQKSAQSLWKPWSLSNLTPLQTIYAALKKYRLIFNYTSDLCNRPNMYQCMNSSKCISIHRLVDSIYDCPYMDDENSTIIKDPDLIKRLEQTHYKCQTSDKYIHRSLIKDGICDCQKSELKSCEDENPYYLSEQYNISLELICDGFVELLPIDINGKNETDETECHQWECDNIYTRCNDEWNCPNGADEIGCRSASVPSINCSSNHRICVSRKTSKLICLPIEKSDDGIVDCIGGTDETMLCPSKVYDNRRKLNFYCKTNTSQRCLTDALLCDGHNDCENEDDEQFCTTNQSSELSPGICQRYSVQRASDVAKFLCQRPDWRSYVPGSSFKIFPKLVLDIKDKAISSVALNPRVADRYQPRCHRGLDLNVWFNDRNNSVIKCLCPPSFYGGQCQYQSQRISLSIAFRASSDSWQTLFTIVISLIEDNDQRMIHSYEQLSFLWTKHCTTTYNIYLLYATRPKDPTKNYTIHIDFFERVSRLYRGSVSLPADFLFLPIQRISFLVDIPPVNDNGQNCSWDACKHGKCIRYSNNQQKFKFCRCDQGWSGRYCTIQHECTCAPDSLCIGITANNRSICVCPRNRFGPRCLLTETICRNEANSTCQNGGQCIADESNLAIDRKYVCVCPKSFSGNRCQTADNKLILSFDKDIVSSQSIFLHFIDISLSTKPERLTTFRTNPIRRDSVTIYWSQPFHIVFTELANTQYYLTVLQHIYNKSATMNKTIHSSDRCPNISEIFNQTFFQWHPLRRVKYYQLPCQNQSLNLSCFHDDIYMCLCYTFGRKRLASCFEFNHNLTFNCFGQSECENGAQCFQDSPSCPHRSICLCQPCFYGKRCQFSTSGFGLSLDAIIGYHISPDVRLTDQPPIIQFSFVLMIVLIVGGLIDGLFCLITFKNKAVREVGCGLYLFTSSINTLLMTMVFGLKFFILLLAQMTIVSNRSFLEVQCLSIDFILRVCLCLDQWLNACVAIERTMTVIKATRFDRKKSRQAAKFVIIILFGIIIGSYIHDPVHRRLIDEGNNDAYDDDGDNVKRTWCTVTYPYTLQFYNSFMHIFHFCGPFIINIISVIVLIISKSYQQSNIHKKRSLKIIFREQIKQHKHLLTAPIALVILGLPRLIIASVSKCTKSSDDAWLFIIGYFISSLPPMLTFVIFVVPSEFYRKQFHESIVQLRTTIQRRLYLAS